LFVQLVALVMELFDREFLIAVESTSRADERELHHPPNLPNRLCSFESRLRHAGSRFHTLAVIFRTAWPVSPVDRPHFQSLPVSLPLTLWACRPGLAP
jgi:hypothetical protein